MTRDIAVVVTARASYSRIRTALEAIRSHSGLRLHLVVAGSALLDRYGSAVSEIERDGFEIAERVSLVLEGDEPALMSKSTAIGMLELSTFLSNTPVDAVVTVADRYETIATAISAAYMNIPLVHVQGGEVSGSIDEKVRHAVTKLADLHLVSTELAADRVMKMGELRENVHVTGCPSIDLAAEALARPELDFDPFEKYGGVGDAPDISDGYVVVMQHPVTTEHRLAGDHITETLNAVEGSGMPALWFWPNVDAGTDATSNGIRRFRERGLAKDMQFFKNMAPLDFLRLIVNASVLVGNSSVGIRESSFLGVPVVNIGSRQEGRERAENVTDVGYARDEIGGAISDQAKHGRYGSSQLYGDGKAGEKIAQLLAEVSFTTSKRLTY